MRFNPNVARRWNECRSLRHRPARRDIMGRDMDNGQHIAGQVDIAESAIAELVRDAVRTCYGVVGIGTSSRRGLSARLPRPWRRQPIAISADAGRISVTIPIVVEYGTPITTVARNVIQTVAFHLRQSLGLDVERVDVRVSGLRHEAAGRTPEL
jgi:uncharacterized alkaline shock family protein YloU